MAKNTIAIQMLVIGMFYLNPQLFVVALKDLDFNTKITRLSHLRCVIDSLGSRPFKIKIEELIALELLPGSVTIKFSFFDSVSEKLITDVTQRHNSHSYF